MRAASASKNNPAAKAAIIAKFKKIGVAAATAKRPTRFSPADNMAAK